MSGASIVAVETPVRFVFFRQVDNSINDIICDMKLGLTEIVRNEESGVKEK